MNVFQIDRAFNYETVTEKQQIRIGREMRAESAKWTMARIRNRSSGSRFPIMHRTRINSNDS